MNSFAILVRRGRHLRAETSFLSRHNSPPRKFLIRCLPGEPRAAKLGLPRNPPSLRSGQAMDFTLRNSYSPALNSAKSALLRGSACAFLPADPLFMPPLYVSKNGKQHGPYTLEQLDQLLQSETFTGEDFFWHQNATAWQPISRLPGYVPPPAPSPAPPAPTPPSPATAAPPTTSTNVAGPSSGSVAESKAD